MNSRTPGARRGAHRTSRDVAGSLVPSLLAMLAVAALVVSLYVWRGEDAATDRTRQAADRSSAAPMTTGSATPRSTATSDQPSSPAVTSSSSPASPAPPATTKKSSKPAASDDVVGGIEVVVLNQTRRGGLAASVAELLREKGWTVPATGNFRGQVPSTTVYYPDGAEAQARLAAAGLPTEPRVRPRFGNLSPNRLTVVVTDSYPS